MNNYEAIIRMTRNAMERFLDQVYLAGINNGMCAARQEDTGLLDCNPFNAHWLSETAEKATTGEVDEDGDGDICSMPWWKLSSVTQASPCRKKQNNVKQNGSNLWLLPFCYAGWALVNMLT